MYLYRGGYCVDYYLPLTGWLINVCIHYTLYRFCFHSNELMFSLRLFSQVCVCAHVNSHACTSNNQMDKQAKSDQPLGSLILDWKVAQSGPRQLPNRRREHTLTFRTDVLGNSDESFLESRKSFTFDWKMHVLFFFFWWFRTRLYYFYILKKTVKQKWNLRTCWNSAAQRSQGLPGLLVTEEMRIWEKHDDFAQTSSWWGFV